MSPGRSVDAFVSWIARSLWSLLAASSGSNGLEDRLEAAAIFLATYPLDDIEQRLQFLLDLDVHSRGVLVPELPLERPLRALRRAIGPTRTVTAQRPLVELELASRTRARDVREKLDE